MHLVKSNNNNELIQPPLKFDGEGFGDTGVFIDGSLRHQVKAMIQDKGVIVFDFLDYPGTQTVLLSRDNAIALAQEILKTYAE
jgi:hypothetical protein